MVKNQLTKVKRCENKEKLPIQIFKPIGLAIENTKPNIDSKNSAKGLSARLNNMHPMSTITLVM